MNILAQLVIEVIWEKNKAYICVFRCTNPFSSFPPYNFVEPGLGKPDQYNRSYMAYKIFKKQLQYECFTPSLTQEQYKQKHKIKRSTNWGQGSRKENKKNTRKNPLKSAGF